MKYSHNHYNRYTLVYNFRPIVQGFLSHHLLYRSISITMSSLLIVGHSFVRRLRQYVEKGKVRFDVAGSHAKCNIIWNRGRLTVSRLWGKIDTITRCAPTTVILDIGTIEPMIYKCRQVRSVSPVTSSKSPGQSVDCLPCEW